MTEPNLTISEVSRLLGMHRRTILRWCQQGRLAGYQTPGGHWRIPRAALEGLAFTTAEYARIVGVHPLTVRRWCIAGRIACRQTPGGHWLVAAGEVERLRGGRPTGRSGGAARASRVGQPVHRDRRASGSGSTPPPPASGIADVPD